MIDKFSTSFRPLFDLFLTLFDPFRPLFALFPGDRLVAECECGVHAVPHWCHDLNILSSPLLAHIPHISQRDNTVSVSDRALHLVRLHLRCSLRPVLKVLHRPAEEFEQEKHLSLLLIR